MIRISFIFSVLLIFSVNAKPMKKMSDELLKKMVVSLDEKGKIAWGTEVEPPEDMDGIHYEIDPSMKIWKNMKISEHHLKPEEDLDEMYHPSTLDLQAQIRKFEQKAEKKNEHQHSPAKMEQMREVRIHLQPEEDMDDLHHKDLLLPALKPGLVRAAVDLPSQRKYLKPEEDLDDLYHRKLLLPVVQQEVREAPAVLPSQRKYTKPEEDLDDLYHRKLLLPVVQQEVREAPAVLPSQRKYTKPEEDLDGLYHQ
ncbi:uncharacterized protein si:ch211-217g15.3 [Cyprinodon tularosa]|uniref:uncharacterized protein si:ch211-217g15.3 n=1 Tax=Cyprinodon tularosa TaxID=77115 RepID=UPI0018E2392B|nr:uncharacterized protein si:ch211-217g15.3 [Cyprinodon tularosa]